MRVLIVENDTTIGKARAKLLEADGFHTEIAETADDTIDFLRHYPFDLVLLKLALPDGEGTVLIRRIRAATLDVPILAFANRSSDRQRALWAGADDAVEPATEPEEWMIRIRAIVRRARDYSQPVIQFGALQLSLESRAVSVAGRPIYLTRREGELLHLLLLRRNTIMTREVILSHLYGGLDEPEFKIIDVFISKIRKKLAEAGMPKVIGTVWGRGYTIGDNRDTHKSNLNPLTTWLEPEFIPQTMTMVPE